VKQRIAQGYLEYFRERTDSRDISALVGDAIDLMGSNSEEIKENM